MSILVQLQNEVKTIKAENKKAYDEYYILVDDIDNKVDNEEMTEDEGLRQDAELRIKLKLSSLDAKYRKAIDGTIHINGTVTTNIPITNTSNIIATLPSGYLPDK